MTAHPHPNDAQRSELRWDVAISFAGDDREIARKVFKRLRAHGLTVYFDEKARAETVGQDLFERLQKIYLRQARCCVAIISKHYLTGRWPRFELTAALERLLEDAGYLLPIRLDDTSVPGLPDSIGYASLADLDDVVELAGRRARTERKAEPAEHRDRPAMPSSTTPVPQHPVDHSFDRHVNRDVVEISDADLVARCRSLPEDRDQWLAWRLASDLVRHLAWNTEISTGTAYTCWRSGNRVYLSTAPGVLTQQQQTVEFRIAGDALFLVAIWRSETRAWARFEYDEYHDAVQGLMTDRSGLNALREGSILTLRKRGAAFGFPVVPRPDEPEGLCGWVEEELEAIPFDWDRDPRLGEPRFGVWANCHHVESGAVMLVFMLYGAWTNAALETMRDMFEEVLSGRTTTFMCAPGAMRIAVLLATAEATGMDRIDRASAEAVVDAVYVSIACALASQRDLPMAPLNDRVRIAAPTGEEKAALRSAHRALGAQESPPLSDDWAPSDAEWLKPRHSVLNVQYDLAPQFDFRHTSTSHTLRDYISALAGRLTLTAD